MKLSDLAIIGDRRTCALIDKQGIIVWYCPNRFDYPSAAFLMKKWGIMAVAGGGHGVL